MTRSLIDLLQDAVRRNRMREALVHDGTSLCYGELWKRVEALAGFLVKKGVMPGTRVALLMENRAEYVVAYYAVLAARGTVVALNTAAKERDLCNWISHSGAAWLIGQSTHPAWRTLQQDLPDVRLIEVGERGAAGAISWQEAADGSMAFKMPEISEELPAAIIYTSGTTGRPKGVTLSHKNLATNVASILGYLPISSDTRTLNVLPFYYSYGNSVLHTHLAAGACLVLENSLTYPHLVVERMAREKVTAFNGVPSTYALLLSRVKFENYDLSALRFITQAGGAMPPAVAQRLRDRLPGVQVFIMYGQTEATARLSYLPPDRIGDKTDSVGVAVPGVTLEIRAEDGACLPAGAEGEVWARGENVMLGYWRDTDATAQVLMDGWLRTGDIGHMDRDGFLFLKGRRSDMIKSGAHRINPNDIEEVIAEVDGVAEVAVVGVDDEILGQVIRAVVVPRPGRLLDIRAIKAHCRDRLAAYKIPKFIDFAAELPKTASGKVKRFELAAIDVKHQSA